MEEDTSSLRKAAPHWSLDGDKQLLDMLQKIHQKLLTKCVETNGKLEAMVDALDNASIDLQNVNNKFMALSNSQFVESRVYDDDVDVSTEGNTSKIEPPQKETESEILTLKQSLHRLEEMHEPVHILDSDSSDDEDNGRIILKPKDVYSHRPLPYIIGSQAWKSKWHAGLIQEESDSDSSVSKHDNIPAQEYSDSEPETAPTGNLAHRTISSSSFESEVTSQPLPQPQPQATSRVTTQPAKPADIAAELARRLGGPVQLPASEPVNIVTPPEATSKKVYRVGKPESSTIFSDEPPPLDDYQSYKSDYTDDDDIFAELHKKPNAHRNRDQNRVAADLFGGLNDDVVDDLFGEVETRDSDIGNIVDYRDVKPSTSDRQKSPVLDRHEEISDSSTEIPVPKSKSIETKIVTENAVKKPVGGISLFGTNKGAESIGAAILKRNQRKSSASDEDTSNAPENKQNFPNVPKTKEEPVNKIIEDLFSRPSKKVIKKEETKREEPAKLNKAKDKIDLFSDNLFDDIDDIFTTNIVTKTKDNKPQKSIFDDDDLFADITIKKPEKQNSKSNTSIFDSNVDLFSESENVSKTEVKIPSNPLNTNKKDMITEIHATANKVVDEEKTIKKRLFDDDTEDTLFSNIKVNVISKPRIPVKINVEEPIISSENINKNYARTETANDENKSLNNELESKSLLNPIGTISQLESPSLFDDDEFNDLFDVEHKQMTETMESNKVTENKPRASLNVVETSENTLKPNSRTENKVSNVKNNNTYIPVDTAQLDISKPHEHIGGNNDTRKNMSKDNVSNSIDDIPNQPKDITHSKTLDEDLNNTISPDITTLENSGVLSDIFPDLPPVFEKQLEPKKSKNVNALFDDDSDDETLFFKKNEAVSDEKPDLNFSSDRFRIFHDEPPEIDIDFSQKPTKNQTSLNELSCDKSFEGLPKFQEKNIAQQSVDLDEKNMVTNVDITKLIEASKESDEKQEVNVSKLLESFEVNTHSDSAKDITSITVANEAESFSNKDVVYETEPKKSIGKLKQPVNLNINVNTLLPGASLNKPRMNEETDGQTISSKSNEELNIHSPEKAVSKMVKSVSFDGDPESEVLDNKLSKERAKIQVKRRPSSRRARLEAVRKSRIDLASDSTDNSSSFDEPPYKEIVNRESEGKVETSVLMEKPISSEDFSEITNPEDLSPVPNFKPRSLKTQQKEIDNLIDKKITQTDVKSKVVYILNDEDIFDNVNTTKEDKTGSDKEHTKNVLSIVDDDDEEFLFKTPNISTLGKTYSKKNNSRISDVKLELGTEEAKESIPKSSGIINDNSAKTTKSLFDDLSDDEEELFGSKKPTVQKTNIFDSDSEGELFIKSKSKPSVDTKIEAIKGSLFGDESDDDDLFGVKTAKPTGNMKQSISKAKEVTARTSEPVFKDPLSMFGDDS